MLPKIVKRLKTGSVKNVVPYGKKTPAAPYDVVRLETLEMGRGIRVIAHRTPEDDIALENYVFDELSTLLSGFTDADRFGNRFTVLDSGEWTEVVTGNDDGTISMERLFYVPFMTS